MLSRLEETPEEQSRRRGMLTSLTTEMQGRGPRVSSFGMHDGESVRPRLGRPSGACGDGAGGRGLSSGAIFSRFADTGAASWRERKKMQGVRPRTGDVGLSARVREGRCRQAELKKQEQSDGGARRMRAAM